MEMVKIPDLVETIPHDPYVGLERNPAQNLHSVPL